MVAWRGGWRTLERERFDCRIFDLLYGTGQASGCFADIPNTLNLKAAPRSAASFLAAVASIVIEAGLRRLEGGRPDFSAERRDAPCSFHKTK
jgi:hypothetical protein